MSIPDFFEGKTLGNYSIVQKLGEGGMGAVYLARDLSLERAVALKVIAPDLARNSQLMARFRVEAIAQARLNHTNIVTIHSFSQQEDTFFIVMEFVEGKTLKDIISERGILPVNQALLIISHLLDGIAYAHSKGVLHRDIKPANIFVTSDHNVKIGDFGIAKVEGIDGLTRVGSHLGTPLYSSPEQIRGERTGPATDFYAIGITLYEMVTGTTPFTSTTGSNYEILQGHLEKTPPRPACYNREITPAVEALILRSLSKSPNTRFASAAEFKTEVDKLLGGTKEAAGKHINIPNIKFPRFHLPRMKPPAGIRLPRFGNLLKGFQFNRKPSTTSNTGFSIANIDRRLLLLILIPLLIIILAMILYSDTGNSGKIYHRHFSGSSLLEMARPVEKKVT